MSARKWDKRKEDLSLFARARADDPETSHDAADRMNKSGAVSAHANLIITALAAFGRQTAKELGQRTELGQHACARRMKELVDSGRVEVVAARDRQQVYALRGE